MQQTKLVLFCELFVTCCLTFEYVTVIAHADENHCNESNKNFINSAYASDIYLPFINKSDCDGRESNPGQLLGRQLC